MLLKRPRTIQIFLPSGDPCGIRIAEQTTSIIRLIEVPRSDMTEFLRMPEARQVGVYFLLSGDSKDEIYIGQSDDVGARLTQHHKDESKDWERALVIVSLTNNLTRTHVLYLESISIEKTRRCQRYELLNGNSGQKPYTPVPLKADCEEIHEIASLLLATLGYPIFESLIEPATAQEKQLFICNRAGVDARAFYTNEGMVVLQGSTAPFDVKRKTDPRIIEKRSALLSKGILVREGNNSLFQRDYLFKTPSGASAFLLLGSSNGWVDWKTLQGVTLHDYHQR
jgi:predicted GIY-YIG superfamily endonuclease